MTYEEALDYLSQLVNYEQQSPSTQDLALEPVRVLLSNLDNPHARLFIVHIAGTNGKGSVASMLERILREAGYRTGLYTSPALGCFEDRIHIDGRAISHTAVADLVGQIQKVTLTATNHGIRCVPTFFDATTALAFLYFALERVDIAIVEVGMGGRTDSTNVCTPRVGIISSISYDHTKQLGHTLGLIAKEKAGIIKPGCVTISGVTGEDARNVVVQACREQNSSLKEMGIDFSYSYAPGEVSRRGIILSRLTIVTERRRWPELFLNLLGAHQAANAAIVVATIEQLQNHGFHIGEEAVLRGFFQVRCPARIEIVGNQPLVLLDSAHNIAAAQALVHTLRASFPDHLGQRCLPAVRRLLIFAASRDKDLAGMMAILGPYFHHIYLTQYSRSKRSATETMLMTSVRDGCPSVPVTYTNDAVDAWRLAKSAATAQDLVCVTGSVFLAGQLRPFITEEDYLNNLPGEVDERANRQQ